MSPDIYTDSDEESESEGEEATDDDDLSYDDDDEEYDEEDDEESVHDSDGDEDLGSESYTGSEDSEADDACHDEVQT